MSITATFAIFLNTQDKLSPPIRIFGKKRPPRELRYLSWTQMPSTTHYWLSCELVCTSLRSCPFLLRTYHLGIKCRISWIIVRHLLNRLAFSSLRLPVQLYSGSLTFAGFIYCLFVIVLTTKTVLCSMLQRHGRSPCFY